MEKKIKLNTPVNTNAMQLVVILQDFGCYVKNKINESVCDELDEMDIMGMACDLVVELLANEEENKKKDDNT